MRGIYFIFDCGHLLYYKSHKINFKGVGSYVDFPDWIKNKKAIVNPVSRKDKCFQYALTVALNHEGIGKIPEKITKIKTFYR